MDLCDLLDETQETMHRLRLEDYLVVWEADLPSDWRHGAPIDPNHLGTAFLAYKIADEDLPLLDHGAVWVRTHRGHWLVAKAIGSVPFRDIGALEEETRLFWVLVRPAVEGSVLKQWRQKS